MPTGGNKGKRYTYVWVSLVILVFGIIFIPKIVDRLKGKSVVQNDRMSMVELEKSLGYVVNEGQRRKVPEFRFLNQDSVWVSDKDYLGKVYVVEFFFTTCPTICPIMTKNLLALQNTFSEQEDFGVASFTINPRYDTPSVLKAYQEKNGVEDPDWNLLTGDFDTIYQLAKEGFYLPAEENSDAPGGFEHSGMLALVDKQGYLRSREDSFGNPIIYYRGTVTEKQGVNEEGEPQQITILKEDIQKLLAE